MKRFCRERTIKRRSHILRLLRKGRKRKKSTFSMRYMEKAGEQPAYAVLVSKKTGNAVTRNYAKRLLREAIAQHCIPCNTRYDMVYITHRHTTHAPLQKICSDVQECIQSI